MLGLPVGKGVEMYVDFIIMHSVSLDVDMDVCTGRGCPAGSLDFLYN